MAEFDVVGVGLNATDTMILIPHFPSYGGKVPFTAEIMSPGGQVASAMVCCAKLGLRTRYIGAIGGRRAGPHSVGKPSGHGHQPGSRSGPPKLRQPVGLHSDRPAHGRADGLLEQAGLPENGAFRTLRRDDLQCRTAAHRRPRHGAGGTSGADRTSSRHSRNRGCGHDLQRLRGRVAERGLPDHEQRVPSALDRRGTTRSRRWNGSRRSTAYAVPQ